MNDNKLIAEFMGYVYDDDRFFMEDSEGIRLYENLPHELQYHTSWDWLMPAVQKCFDTQQPAEGQHYFINESLLTMDMGVVYDRVVEFIKTYNNDTI